MNTTVDLRQIARQIRLDVLNMSYRAHIGHVGSCYSIAEILSVLYFHTLKLKPENSSWEDRDRFILSKGHAAAALYAALARRGFFPIAELETYCQNGSRLAGHPEKGEVPGIEAMTGSLGHGLPLGLGMAVAAKSRSKNWRTIVLLSDGECNEGTTWEAALAAPQFRLDNLIAIIDRNGLQAMGRTEETMRLEPLVAKWESFGWAVREIDGHDVEKIKTEFDRLPFASGQPNLIIARTVLGKGVSFMENRLEWHYLDPKEEHYRKALAELERAQIS